MRNLFLCALYFFTTLFFVSCDRERIDFEKEYNNATKLYFSANIENAKSGIQNFISLGERHVADARNARNVNYNLVMGMMWLRLSTIYSFSNQDKEEQDAINKAIIYFDQEPNVSRDLNYKNNKKKTLLDLIEKTESYEMPTWKSSKDMRNTLYSINKYNSLCSLKCSVYLNC